MRNTHPAPSRTAHPARLDVLCVSPSRARLWQGRDAEMESMSTPPDEFLLLEWLPVATCAPTCLKAEQCARRWSTAPEELSPDGRIGSHSVCKQRQLTPRPHSRRQTKPPTSSEKTSTNPRPVLKDISLSITPGQLVGGGGANGSGPSSCSCATAPRAPSSATIHPPSSSNSFAPRHARIVEEMLETRGGMKSFELHLRSSSTAVDVGDQGSLVELQDSQWKRVPLHSLSFSSLTSLAVPAALLNLGSCLPSRNSIKATDSAHKRPSGHALRFKHIVKIGARTLTRHVRSPTAASNPRSQSLTVHSTAIFDNQCMSSLEEGRLHRSQLSVWLTSKQSTHLRSTSTLSSNNRNTTTTDVCCNVRHPPLPMADDPQAPSLIVEPVGAPSSSSLSTVH
uniref:Uncharacterized protein n=1 Tax=Mycena chlorophos TaxID=658473 RepID=A0ABQ0LH42_MYCCL|nr:predicted protein [Mycena chlorophos]